MTDRSAPVRGRAENNWALLAAVSLVSFVGAVAYATAGEDSIVIPIYFVAASFGIAAFTFSWFARHPPAGLAPGWAYVAVVVALELGAFFGGAIEDSRAVGAWLAVGLAFVAYGLLERNSTIVATGAIAAALAVAGLISDVSPLGVVLEVATGIVFAAGAWWLRQGMDERLPD